MPLKCKETYVELDKKYIISLFFFSKSGTLPIFSILSQAKILNN